MPLNQLQHEQLPDWQDSNFKDFILQWLQDSGIDITSLCRKGFNYRIQTSIQFNWIGENPEDESNVRDFHEFRFSACILLNTLIVRNEGAVLKHKMHIADLIQTAICFINEN